VGDILELHSSGRPQKPVTAPVETDRTALAELMRRHSVRQVPLVDDEGVVQGLVTASDLVAGQAPPARVRAVIMAGGYGSRLSPLTEKCPKPLLPVGDQPLLSHVIGRLKQAGIRRMSLSTHYLAEQIRRQYGDGSELGVELSYVNEEQPLGTAGALGLMPSGEDPLLVVNGDVLTGMDFQSMLEFHREQRARLTVAVRKYEVQVPFGVVETEGVEVRGLAEKPEYSFFVNAGIYLVEPEACRLVEGGRRLDMTELIQLLLARGEKVASFPVVEYWLDVGSPEAYRQAQEDFSNGRWEL
jgi:NDP-sugar pyrophosphorylase family protein